MPRRAFIRAIIIATCFAVPSLTFAAGLTSPQISAILAILRAFNAEESLVASVALALAQPTDPLPVVASSTPVVPLTRPDTTDSPYTPSHLGYDLSFNTLSYPSVASGFVVVGVVLLGVAA